MEYYRRNLPHWQPKGAEFFITFRLAGSLPAEVINWLKEKRREYEKMNRKLPMSDSSKKEFEAEIFKMYDHLLDESSFGPTWLKKREVAEIVMNSLHFYDKEHYDLYAFTIMSNHVHLVFRHLTQNYDVDFPVTGIMKSIKSFTGKECNKKLCRSGRFWQIESYDRVIRDSRELENVILYTINNPVKANLVSQWKDWPYTYCKSEFCESL